MIVVGVGRLTEFSHRHPDARPWLENWLAHTRGAVWKTPQDVKNRYRSASFPGGNRVIFNVRGNRYRMEATIAYETGRVAVNRIATHAE